MFNKIEIMQKILKKKSQHEMTEGSLLKVGDVETERHRKPAHFHFLYGVVQGDPSPPGRELVDVKPVGGRQEARMLALLDGEEKEEEIFCLHPLETVDLTMEEDRESRVAKKRD